MITMNNLELKVVPLSNDDLRNVQGGFLGFIPIIAGIIVVTELVSACYAAGEKIGEGIYNITH